MKQYKKIIAAVAAAAILALPLSGCSFNDVMLYLYGGDSFTKEEGEDYQTYDEELNEEAQTVRYDFDLTIPDAETESVRYDCGTYQMILAEVNYDCGVTLHVSAASRSASYDQIVALLQNVYPTGHTPETAE